MTMRDSVVAAMIWTAFSAVVISGAEEIAWLYEYFVQGREVAKASQYAAESHFAVIGVAAIIIGLCSIVFSDPKEDADRMAMLKLAGIGAVAGMALVKTWIAFKTDGVAKGSLPSDTIGRTLVLILAGFFGLVAIPSWFKAAPKLLRHALIGAVCGLLLGLAGHGALRVCMYFMADHGWNNVLADRLRPSLIVWSVFAGMFAFMLHHLSVLSRKPRGDICQMVALASAAVVLAAFVGLSERSGAFINAEQSKLGIMAYYGMLGACIMAPGIVFYNAVDQFRRFAGLAACAVASVFVVAFGAGELLDVSKSANLSDLILGGACFAMLHVAILASAARIAQWNIGKDET